MPVGWGKIKTIASYIDSCPRTVRTLIKRGLPYVRLPSGTILIAFSDVDDFLRKYEVKANKVDDIVEEVLRDFEGEK